MIMLMTHRAEFYYKLQSYHDQIDTIDGIITYMHDLGVLSFVLYCRSGASISLSTAIACISLSSCFCLAISLLQPEHILRPLAQKIK